MDMKQSAAVMVAILAIVQSPVVMAQTRGLRLLAVPPPTDDNRPVELHCSEKKCEVNLLVYLHKKLESGKRVDACSVQVPFHILYVPLETDHKPTRVEFNLVSAIEKGPGGGGTRRLEFRFVDARGGAPVKGIDLRTATQSDIDNLLLGTPAPTPLRPFSARDYKDQANAGTRYSWALVGAEPNTLAFDINVAQFEHGRYVRHCEPNDPLIANR